MNVVRTRFQQYVENPTTGRELERALSLMRDHVCDQQATLLRRLRKRQAREALLLSLGGLSLIAVDVSALSTLSPIGIAVSFTLGGGLAKDGIAQLISHV
jgi:hypothetical protein